MSAVRHLQQHPEIAHGPIRLCFNPDEEIARGVTKLDLAQLGAVCGYTLDGSSPGEIEFESFSADAAVLEIQGVAAHPGWAQGVMVNALRLAGRFVAALPPELSPERTAGRAGFIHPVECSGTSERAKVRLILRDFELAGLAAQRAQLENITAALRLAEPQARLTLTFTEQYRNMRYWLEKDLRPVEYARTAIRRAGLTPHSSPIRGGTDGSSLTQRGAEKGRGLDRQHLRGIIRQNEGPAIVRAVDNRLGGTRQISGRVDVRKPSDRGDFFWRSRGEGCEHVAMFREQDVG